MFRDIQFDKVNMARAIFTFIGVKVRVRMSSLLLIFPRCTYMQSFGIPGHLVQEEEHTVFYYMDQVQCHTDIILFIDYILSSGTSVSKVS